MPEYLPRTATFIYTQLRFQEEFSPVVLAHATSNLTEFPLGSPIYELAPRWSSQSVWSRLTSKFVDLNLADYASSISVHARSHECVALHAHFGWSGIPSLRAQRELGIPLITTFYGRDLAARKRRLARSDYYAELFEEGTLFICEGPEMGKTLEGLGCPRGKIRIIRIGLDLSQFPFRPPPPSDLLVVMQGARLVEKKGVDLSIRAYAEAADHLPPSELWIVGDGPDRQGLERLAAETGLKSIRFFGEVTHERYRELAAQAHVCIQPSRTAGDGDTEGGAPTVLIEMQAAGVPIVATRHADIPFVVADPDRLVGEEDVSGLARELVRTTSLDELERHARAKEARTFVEENHDARLIARRIEALYAEARVLDEKV